MDALNNIDRNAKSQLSFHRNFHLQHICYKDDCTSGATDNLTSGLLMGKFIFEIWKSLILMAHMPSPSTHSTESLVFIHWLRSYLI
jgi:hypothetical protein